MIPLSCTKLEEEADIKTLLGGASFPNILVNAGINDADMVVAVTGSDENKSSVMHDI
jgi:trk system potassium uptake protein TrkA